MSCRARLPPTSKARSPAARWCVSTDAAPASYPRVGYGAAGPPARAAYRISAPFRGPVMSQRSVSAGTRLREAVEAERPLQVVGTIDAYAALLAQNAGFRAIYLSGAGVANASFGLPDLGITTLNEVCEDVRRISAACPLPLLVDADTGFGDRKSTRLNSSHEWISYAVFCLKKKILQRWKKRERF